MKNAMIAAFLAVLGFAAIVSSPSSAQTTSFQPCGITTSCNQCCEKKIQVRRRIVGYRVVRQPIYRAVTISPQPCCAAPHPQSIAVAPAQCQGDCAIDLRATYVGCLIRDGHQLWQYRTERGVFNMTMQRLNEVDMIRIKGTMIAWVRG